MIGNGDLSGPSPRVVGTHLAPGAGSDTVARITAEKMSEGLSQPVVVENRSGAGGMLANRYVAGAAPDGYTLLLVTGAYRAQAAVLKELSFDPLKDISMISLLMEYPFVLVARPDAPYKSVKELIAYAKRSAIQLNYASSGAGSVHHLTSELFNAMTGIELSPLTDARELWLCPFSTPMNRIYIYIYRLSNPISSGKIAIVKAIVASCQFRWSGSRNASDQALSRRAKD